MKNILLFLSILCAKFVFSTENDSLVFEVSNYSKVIKVEGGFCHVTSTKPTMRERSISLYNYKLNIIDKQDIKLKTKGGIEETMFLKNTYLLENKLYLLYVSSIGTKVELVEYNLLTHNLKTSPVIRVQNNKGLFDAKDFLVLGSFAYLLTGRDGFFPLARGKLYKFNITTGELEKDIIGYKTKLSVKQIYFDESANTINALLYPYREKHIGVIKSKIISFDSFGKNTSLIKEVHKTEDREKIIIYDILYSDKKIDESVTSGIYNRTNLNRETLITNSGFFISKDKTGKLIWSKRHSIEDVIDLEDLELEGKGVLYHKPIVFNDKIIYLFSLCEPKYAAGYLDNVTFHETFIVAFSKETGEHLWSNSFSSHAKYCISKEVREGLSFSKPSTIVKEITANQNIDITVHDGDEIKKIEIDNSGTVLKENTLYKVSDNEKQSELYNKQLIISGENIVEINEIAYLKKKNKYFRPKYVVKKYK